VKLFGRFFPSAPFSLAKEFSRCLPEYELSMAQLQGHLMKYRSGSGANDAVTRVSDLLSNSSPQAEKHMTVYEHLKRVGLERLAACFEMHGYKYKGDLKDVNAETVKNWNFALRYDKHAYTRLTRLLNGDKYLMDNEYPLATVATIKDMFLAKYGSGKRLVKYGSNKLRILLPFEYNLLANEGENLAEEETWAEESAASTDISFITKLADDLSRKLSSTDGKGIVSLWQVRELLEHHPSPEEAVQGAADLVKKRSAKDFTYSPLSVLKFLQRAGMEKYAFEFDQKGYKIANQLLTIKTVESMSKFVRGSVGKTLHVMLQNNDKDANVISALHCSSRIGILKIFLMKYGSGAYQQASDFASLVTSRGGTTGHVSTLQIEKHLEKYSDDATAAVENAVDELLCCKLECPPPKKARRVPSNWVYKAFRRYDKNLQKDHGVAVGLLKLASLFESAGILTKTDLLADPVFSNEELESIGIRKVGEQRLVLRFIKSLRSGAPSHVPAVGDDVVVPAFGKASVKSFREQDNIYELKFPWGRMLCYDDDELEIVPPVRLEKTVDSARWSSATHSIVVQSPAAKGFAVMEEMKETSGM